MSIRVFARIALGLAVTATAVAFGVRLWFVVASGPFAATTGFEEFCLYNIWKVVHGLPLYEWPQKPPFLLTSYNIGFYTAYGAWGRIFSAGDDRLVVYARLLTTVATVIACCLQLHLIRRAVQPKQWAPVWAAGICFLFGFGVTCGPWLSVTARSDVGALAFALGGLALVFRAHERQRWFDWALASLLFFGAWSFKQSVVWIFAGAILHGAWVRTPWRQLLSLIAPFAMLSAAIIWAGGEVYRYNVFVVPTIYRWFPGQSLGLLVKSVLLNPFVWGIGAITLVRRLRYGSVMDRTSDAAAQRMLSMIAIPPLAVGAIQLALHGSAGNNILEGAALLSVLASATWLGWLADRTATTRIGIGAVLLLMMLPFPVVHVVQAARGIPYADVHGASIGNAIKLNGAQLEQRRKFAAWMQTLPKPIWICDAMLEMPWFATGNRYPAYPLDPEFLADARRKQVIEDDGFPALIREKRFAALLLRPEIDAGFIRLARRAGYKEAPVPDEFSPLATEYGVSRPGPLLFLRP